MVSETKFLDNYKRRFSHTECSFTHLKGNSAKYSLDFRYL